MRPAAATVAAILGIVAALCAAVLWSAGRNVLDSDRFASRTVAALGSTPGRAALTLGIAEQTYARTPASIPESEVFSAVGRAVDAAAASPAFGRALAGAVSRAHRRLLASPDEPVSIDLAEVRALVADELAARDPRLVAQLPPASELRDARISTGLRVPAIPGSRLAGHVPALVAVLAPAAALLAALAIAASDRPSRTARRIASAMILLAIVPAAIGVLVPRAAEAAVAPPDDELARDLAERLLDAWPASTIALVLAGAALFALSLLRGGPDPRIRMPGA